MKTQELIGKQVSFQRRITDDNGEKSLTVVNATIIGVEPQEDDKPPVFTLAFLDPKRVNLLKNSDWRTAFDRMVGVREVTDTKGDVWWMNGAIYDAPPAALVPAVTDAPAPEGQDGQQEAVPVGAGQQEVETKEQPAVDAKKARTPKPAAVAK